MNWFNELKLWMAIDSQREATPGNADDAPRMLHQHLQSAKPRTRVPDDLHREIMCQLRTVPNQRQRQPRRAPLLTWNLARAGAGLALVTLLGVAVFSLSRQSRSSVQSSPPTVPVHSMVSVHSPAVLAELPFSVVSPLEEEWRRINQDMTNAAGLLLSSLP